MVSDEIARRMLQRFEGYDRAYGSYNADAAKSTIENGKVEIKSTAFTRRELVTYEHWKRHLNGTTPLGIIPIRDNNTCVWGAIDIDQYDIDIVELIKRIKDEELPFIVCGTKSGGAHLYLFMAEPVPAFLIQARLREMAANLGYGGSEVFPKQKQVELEKDRLGTWLNMPYFGDTRWAYRPDGSTMPVEEFLELAYSLEQSIKFLEDEPEKRKKRENYSNSNSGPLEFRDGPPCMQHLAQTGIESGQRNNGIFQLGVFAKKKFPQNWQEVIDRWNRDIVIPPLSIVELADIIRRLEQKEYFYPCKDQPIVSYCNSAVCRTRKYGVASGGDAKYPNITGLSVTTGDNPVWVMDVNDIQVELTTEQLLTYRSFHKLCVELLHLHFGEMSQKAWGKVIGPFIDDVNLIEVSPEVGLAGHFAETMEEFIDNNITKERDNIVNGNVWLDELDVVRVPGITDKDVGPKYFFRLRDFQKHLYEAVNFKTMTRPQITNRIKNMRGGSHFFTIKGSGVNVWWVLAEVVNRKPQIDPPKVDRPVI